MVQPAVFHSETRQEGIVVWDQRGVVVRWPNGDSSRLSWETLRHISQCAACREQSHQHGSTAQRAISSAISLTL